jgi:hypothetical protein
MVGVLIVFPGMALVYKTPEVDTSKVKIEIPAGEAPEQPEDIMRDLQKGGAAKKDAATELTAEEKAAAEIEKALGAK